MKTFRDSTGREWAITVDVNAVKRVMKAPIEYFGEPLKVNLLALVEPNSELLKRIADRIATIKNPAERTAAAIKIFGRSGNDLLPMLQKGSDGIAKWEARARSLGLVMSGEPVAVIEGNLVQEVLDDRKAKLEAHHAS